MAGVLVMLGVLSAELLWLLPLDGPLRTLSLENRRLRSWATGAVADRSRSAVAWGLPEELRAAEVHFSSVQPRSRV